MAVREFNGTTDRIALGGNNAAIASGARSCVLVVEPLTLVVSAYYIFFRRTTSDGGLFSLGDNGTNRFELNVHYDALKSLNMGKTEDQWQVFGFSKAAGTVATRGHRKLLGSGSWAHTNIGSTSTDGSSDAWVGTDIGCRTNGSAGFASMRIAVAALFDYELADSDYVNLESAATTQAIYDLSPIGLWEFNQASTSDDVLDLIGTSHQTAISGTSVVTTDDPAWTFGVASLEKQSFYGYRRRMVRR